MSLSLEIFSLSSERDLTISSVLSHCTLPPIQVELPRHQFLPLVLLLSTTEQSLTNVDEVPAQLSLLEDSYPLELLIFPPPFEEIHKETFYTFLKKRIKDEIKSGIFSWVVTLLQWQCAAVI